MPVLQVVSGVVRDICKAVPHFPRARAARGTTFVNAACKDDLRDGLIREAILVKLPLSDVS